jgi:prophage regulatory protein
MRNGKAAAAKPTRLSTREWRYFRRGYEIGQFFAREDARAAASAARTDRLLRVTEVMKVTGLGRTTIWQLERDGQFPQRVKLSGSSGRAVGYRVSEISRWISRRMAARQA